MVADRRSGQWRPFKRAAGLPDLFLLHEDPPRMIIAEVKGSGGKLSEAQRKFLRLARNVADQARSHIGVGKGVIDASQRLLGVYAWTPDQQQVIEDILRSKVLLP